jgi:hypothetical protein
MEYRQRDLECQRNHLYSYDFKQKTNIIRVKNKNTVVNKDAYNFLEKFFAKNIYKDCSYMKLIQSIISVNISPFNKMYIQYLDYTLIGDFPKKIITIVTPTKTIIHEENESNNEWTIYCK